MDTEGTDDTGVHGGTEGTESTEGTQGAEDTYGTCTQATTSTMGTDGTEGTENTEGTRGYREGRRLGGHREYRVYKGARGGKAAAQYSTSRGALKRMIRSPAGGAKFACTLRGLFSIKAQGTLAGYTVGSPKVEPPLPVYAVRVAQLSAARVPLRCTSRASSPALSTIEKPTCNSKNGFRNFSGSLRRPTHVEVFCIVHNRKADV